MPKIPQTGGGGISRQEVEQIVHETDNKIKFLPIQGESAYNIVDGLEPKMLNIFHNISVNAPSTYSDFKYSIQQAQHQDETQKEIYSTFNLDFKNYSLEIFVKIVNQLNNLENIITVIFPVISQVSNLENQLSNLENQLSNLENQVSDLENRVSDLENQLNPPERMIMTCHPSPSSEAIIEIMSLKQPLNPGRNFFQITLLDSQNIEVVTPWGTTTENYYGAGDYQTQYIDFKVYGDPLMIGDIYIYEINNN